MQYKEDVDMFNVDKENCGCASIKGLMAKFGVQTYNVDTTVLNMGNHLAIEGPEMGR